jgi:hypothetical protein
VLDGRDFVQEVTAAMAKRYLLFLLTALAVCLIAPAHAKKEPAKVEGEVARCIAWADGKQYLVLNGEASAERCERLARRCAGKHADWSYLPEATLFHGAYTRCDKRERLGKKKKPAE